jgi:hypothetical protein
LTAIIASTLVACSSDHIAGPPPPPTTGVLLKDVVYTRLPSPYYHFEYDDAGNISTASFASGAATYSLHYQSDRIHDIDVASGTVERMFYTYDDARRVVSIRDTDATGANAQLWFFTYNGQQLTTIERDRAVPGGYIIDLQMSFLYDAGGNLLELGQHYPPIDGLQTEQTLVDVFERYDDKVNVDDFDLLHPGFFDKLILLPGVKLQLGNPGRVVHLGDGDHYTVDFTYTYNDQKRPLTRSGTLLFQTGPNAGQSFAVDAAYSYY